MGRERGLSSVTVGARGQSGPSYKQLTSSPVFEGRHLDGEPRGAPVSRGIMGRPLCRPSTLLGGPWGGRWKCQVHWFEEESGTSVDS